MLRQAFVLSLAMLLLAAALVAGSASAATATPATAPADAAAAPAQALDKDQLATALKELLHEQPELVLDVLRENNIEVFGIVEQGIQARRDMETKNQRAAELANPFKPEILPERPILGPKDAPVTIVAYSDFLCSYCARATTTIQQLMAKYPGSIRFVYKHFGESDMSRLLAKLFEAVAMQDQAKAWQLHDQLFARQDEVRKDKKVVDEIVASLNLDQAKLAEDLGSETIENYILADQAEGDKFGFRGTPIFLVNGVSVRGSYPIEEFEQVMDATLRNNPDLALPSENGAQCEECEATKQQ